MQIGFLACRKPYLHSQPDVGHREPKGAALSALSHPAAVRGAENRPWLHREPSTWTAPAAPRAGAILLPLQVPASEGNFKKRPDQMFRQYHCRFQENLNFKDTPAFSTCRNKWYTKDVNQLFRFWASLSRFPACGHDWELHQAYQNLNADLPTLNCLMHTWGDMQKASSSPCLQLKANRTTTLCSSCLGHKCCITIANKSL